MVVGAVLLAFALEAVLELAETDGAEDGADAVKNMKAEKKVKITQKKRMRASATVTETCAILGALETDLSRPWRAQCSRCNKTGRRSGIPPRTKSVQKESEFEKLFENKQKLKRIAQHGGTKQRSAVLMWVNSRVVVFSLSNVNSRMVVLSLSNLAFWRPSRPVHSPINAYLPGRTWPGPAQSCKWYT